MDHECNDEDYHVVVRRPVDSIRRDMESGSLNPLVMDPDHQNLLRVAVSVNNFKIIQYLGEEWDGDRMELLNAVDRFGRTPIHIVCSAATRNREVVEYLLGPPLSKQNVAMKTDPPTFFVWGCGKQLELLVNLFFQFENR